MWTAVARWNARRRSRHERFVEVCRRFDAWPHVCGMIYALCSLPILVSLLGRTVPFVVDLAGWALGIPVVTVMTVIWRRRRTGVARSDASSGFHPFLFAIVAVLTCGFMLIPTAPVVMRQHGPLPRLAVWCAAIALWLFAVYCLATLFARLYRIIRSL